MKVFHGMPCEDVDKNVIVVVEDDSDRSVQKGDAHSPAPLARTLTPDCSLRQGAGGMEFARNGSRSCF